MSTTQTRSPCGAAAVNARLARVLGTPGATMSRLLAYFEWSASGRELVGRGLREFQSSAQTAPDLDKPEAWQRLHTEMAGMSLAQRIAAAWDSKRPQAERCAILSEFVDLKELTALAVQSASQSAQTATPTASPTAASAAPSAKRRPQSKHARRPRTAQIKRSS